MKCVLRRFIPLTLVLACGPQLGSHDAYPPVDGAEERRDATGTSPDVALADRNNESPDAAHGQPDSTITAASDAVTDSPVDSAPSPGDAIAPDGAADGALQAALFCPGQFCASSSNCLDHCDDNNGLLRCGCDSSTQKYSCNGTCEALAACPPNPVGAACASSVPYCLEPGDGRSRHCVCVNGRWACEVWLCRNATASGAPCAVARDSCNRLTSATTSQRACSCESGDGGTRWLCTL
jgi:hypothetical protein